MKKPKIKFNKKNFLKNAIVALALIAATLGAVRLVSHVNNDKNLKQLVKVELNKDFFKDAKEGTETIGSVSYQTFTLDIKKDRKTTYEFKLVVYAGASKDFADTLALDSTATSSYVQITNLKAEIIEVGGKDSTAKKNDVVDQYLPAYTEETNSADALTKATLSPSKSVATYESISFFGLTKDQPK